MTIKEHDWNSLARIWQSSSDEVAAATLSRLIAAERRRLAATVLGEAVTIGAFVALSWIAMRDGLAVWETVWLTTLWLFTAVAAPFAWWNRRGAWSSMIESVAEFERRRTARRRRTLRFSCALFIAEVITVSIQLAWFDRFSALAMWTLVAMTIAVSIWGIWMKRRIDVPPAEM
jgi:hypothetical protein